MKANELRMGNIIWCGHNCTTTHIYGYNPIDNSVKVGSYNLWVPINSIDPIAITEEWLLKFGFNQHTHLPMWICKYIVEEDGIGIFYNKTDNLIYYCQDHVIGIKSVHQLQNLYFALTGTELTIKP